VAQEKIFFDMRERHSLCILVSLILFSCRFPQVKGEAPGINVVERGEKFGITLPEDHRKGETWHLVETTSHGVLERHSEMWHESEMAVDYNFRARAPGQATLTFVKRFYRDTLCRTTYIVKIR
jgi:hypothetical protein